LLFLKEEIKYGRKERRVVVGDGEAKNSHILLTKFIASLSNMLKEKTHR
jgi:hypothetical protein